MSSGITVLCTDSCTDRWQVYHRLQALDIDCKCSSFQPLQVTLRSPTEALQLWSIVRRISEPRQVLIDSLQQSWRAPFIRK
ncbi:MAG: Asr1405/Asl0597 family protein [Cyanobacteria bacterium P01_D01_bin.1]